MTKVFKTKWSRNEDERRWQKEPKVRIPVSPTDLPLDNTPMDESLVYTGILRKVTPSDHLDSQGNEFVKIVAEVTEPEEFAGTMVADNWVPVAKEVPANAGKAERIKIQNTNVKMGRLCAAFKIKTQDMDEWPGHTGKFVV